MLKNFGENVRRLRREKGYSQYDVAAGVNVYQSMISAIESGDKRPSLPLAFAIAEFLGTTLDELSKEHVATVAAAELVAA